MREIARAAGLPVADKRESQDLCFLAGTGKSAFLARHGGVRERPGAIVDRSGRPVGRHRGQHLFTIGQRKGLGVAAEEPLFVLAKDRVANTRDRRHAGGPGDHGGRGARRRAAPARGRRRPRQAALPHEAGRVPGSSRAPAAGWRWTLAEPVDGAAPGQVACLMRGDVIVGHGVIDSLA